MLPKETCSTTTLAELECSWNFSAKRFTNRLLNYFQSWLTPPRCFTYFVDGNFFLVCWECVMQRASKLEKLRTRETTYLSNPPPWDLIGTFWIPVCYERKQVLFTGSREQARRNWNHSSQAICKSTHGQGEESLKFALEIVGLGEVRLVNLLGPWC